MNIGFIDDGRWIMPVEGTIGNKSRNLYNNSGVIEACSFKIPRSLVIPFEYLKGHSPYHFTLEQIDAYFPGWKRIMLRSDAPDEDVMARMPGLYTSEHLWRPDRDSSYFLFERVISSYKNYTAWRARTAFNIPYLGMGLLIQPIVSNTGEDFDADYVGCYSDIGELALLTFNEPKNGERAMEKPPLKRTWVEDGKLRGKYSARERKLAYNLSLLAGALPEIEGRGWEIEFAAGKDSDFVVQTTPVKKFPAGEELSVPENLESVFECEDAVGKGKRVSHGGILYVPPAATLEEFAQFDRSYKDYFVVCSHLAIIGQEKVLYMFQNATGLIDMGHIFLRNAFPAHTGQLIREGKVAVLGDFKERFDWPSEPAFSPTMAVIEADEFKGLGAVYLPWGKFEEFVPLSKLSF